MFIFVYYKSPRWISTGNPPEFHRKSTGNPPEIRRKSTGNDSGKRPESFKFCCPVVCVVTLLFRRGHHRIYKSWDIFGEHTYTILFDMHKQQISSGIYVFLISYSTSISRLSVLGKAYNVHIISFQTFIFCMQLPGIQ